MNFARRLLALVLAGLLTFGPSGVAIAKPKPSSSKADQDVLELAARSEQLLDKLEYERARELLESSVRGPAVRSARPGARAKVWALLGRARAELGDMVGTDEAFLQAVTYDRKVKLSKSTSPKIVEALERARANAPVEGTTEPEPDPPPPPKPEKAPPEKAPPEKAPPEKAPPPLRTDPKEPPPKGPKTPKEPPPKAAPKEPPVKAPPPKPRPLPNGPFVRHRIVGAVLPGRRIKLVVESGQLGKKPKLELKIRRTQSGEFKKVPLSKSGTVSLATLDLDRPRLEFFVEAYSGKKLVARDGSPYEPIVITTVAPPPPIATAWSEPDPRRGGNTRSSTVAGAHTSSVALQLRPPPPPPPPTVVMPVEDDGLSPEAIGLIIAGSAVVAAGVVILVVVLASGKSDCEAKEGLGCVEVRISPLLSF